MQRRNLAIAAFAALISPSAFAHDSDYCREFTKTIYVGGRPQQGYGTSCMQPDGSWQIVQRAQPVNDNYQPQWEPQPAQYVQRVEYIQPRYYAPRPYYRPSPFLFSINYSNWGGGWGHNNWHDNDHDRGHNNGHGHDDHHGDRDDWRGRSHWD